MDIHKQFIGFAVVTIKRTVGIHPSTVGKTYYSILATKLIVGVYSERGLLSLQNITQSHRLECSPIPL